MIVIKGFARIRLIFIMIAFMTHILNTDGSVRKFSCGTLTGCLGKNGTNFILSTLEDVSHVDCAMRCEEMNQCMLFFHNSRTRSCSFHNRTLTDIRMIEDLHSRCFMADNIVESWIVEILSVSESSSLPNYPVTNTIGPGDEQWWVRDFPHPKEFLEVRFFSEMYIEQIHIYGLDGYYCGVIGVSLLTPNGTWYPVWSTSTGQLETDISYYARPWSIELTMTNFKTSVVHIDTENPPYDFAVIDAIRVSGKEYRVGDRSYAP